MKITSIISILILLISCGRQREGSLATKTKDNVDTIFSPSQYAIKSTEKSSNDLIMYALVNSDTIYIKEQGKVFNINVLSDSIFTYMVFESYNEETDFGETKLYVRDSRNNLLWSKKLSDYSSLAINNRFVMISDVNLPLINFYHLRSGDLFEKKDVEFVIDDSNQFFASNNKLYILVTKEDGSFKDIIYIECNDSFEKKWMELNLQGFYTLAYQGQNKVVLLSANNEVIRYLE